jgi:RHS repeat-associated protein
MLNLVGFFDSFKKSFYLLIFRHPKIFPKFTNPSARKPMQAPKPNIAPPKCRSLQDSDVNGVPYQYFYYTAPMSRLPTSKPLAQRCFSADWSRPLARWGETLIEEKATRPGMHFESPYRFNAKELDEESGLYYYGARYYNPMVSVWLGVDPLAHKYPNMTSYVFTGNNPVMLVDPDGRQIRVNGADAKTAMRALVTKYTAGDINKAKKLFNLSAGSYEKGLYLSRDVNLNKKAFSKRAKSLGLSKKETKEAFVLHQAIVSNEEIQVEVLKTGSGSDFTTFTANDNVITNYDGASWQINGNENLEKMRQDIIENGGCSAQIIEDAVRPKQGPGTGPYAPDALGDDYSIFKGVPDSRNQTQVRATILIDGTGKTDLENGLKILEALNEQQ